MTILQYIEMTNNKQNKMSRMSEENKIRSSKSSFLPSPFTAVDWTVFVFINLGVPKWWYSTWTWDVCSLPNIWLPESKTESKLLNCCYQAQVSIPSPYCSLCFPWIMGSFPMTSVIFSISITPESTSPAKISLKSRVPFSRDDYISAISIWIYFENL